MATRTNPANTIDGLCNGDEVQIAGPQEGAYVYVYVPKFGLNGYVDIKHL